MSAAKKITKTSKTSKTSKTQRKAMRPVKKTAKKAKKPFGQIWNEQSEFRRSLWARMRIQLKQAWVDAATDEDVIALYEELTGREFEGMVHRNPAKAGNHITTAQADKLGHVSKKEQLDYLGLPKDKTLRAAALKAKAAAKAKAKKAKAQAKPASNIEQLTLALENLIKSVSPAKA